MQILSLIWGILAFVGMFIGFIPCLGWLNWANIPFAVVGLIVSGIAHATHRGPNKTTSLIGLILCGIAILIGAKRLVWGGGVL